MNSSEPKPTRAPPTVGDYVVTALSPVLILGLVGSLAFFLLDVLYAGKHIGRLQWTLFFFVMGAVAVSRVAIQVDAAKAWGYRIALGLVAFLAMAKFVEYPPDSGLVLWGPVFNSVIIVVVLWSANRLTWDCTFVDESAEDGSGGLLEEIREELQSDPASRERERPAESSAKNPPVADVPGSPKTTRPMGRWVVYFSLAALPLFGLGQSLIPADDAERRRHAFWLMSVYVASGLGLLLTTTLLGLRRYLRQRKLQMPAAMTGLWLGLGAAIIVSFLLAATFLPRPNSEYALVRFTPVGSHERDASRFAPDSHSAGKSEGRPGAQGEDKNARDGSGGKGQKDGKAAGESGKPEGQGDNRSGGQGKSQAKSNEGGGDRGRDGKSADDRSTSNRPNERSKSGAPPRQTTEGDRQRDTSGQQTGPTGAFAKLADILKWIVLAILATIVALVVLWFLARHLAGVSDWARKLFEALSTFWRSLFGGAAPEADDVVESVVVQERPRPFADFSNPFNDGSAGSRSPEDLVQYSFTALEAWAYEQDMQRRQDETPLEFADRVASETPVGEEARKMVGLYTRLAYARQRLPAASRAQVEAFWRVLDPARLDSKPLARL